MDKVKPIGWTTTPFMTVIMCIMAIALLLVMIVAISLLLATIILPPSLQVIMSIQVGCYITIMVMSVRTIILPPLNAKPTIVIAVRLTMDRAIPIGLTTTPFMTVIMSIISIALLLTMIVAISLLLATIILPSSLQVIMSLRVR